MAGTEAPEGANTTETTRGTGLVPTGERDAEGRFVAGNTVGRMGGRPTGHKAALIRRAIAEALTIDDHVAMARALCEKAKAGDVDAAKLLWERLLGKPVQGIYDATAEADAMNFDDEGTRKWIVERMTAAGLAAMLPPGWIPTPPATP